MRGDEWLLHGTFKFPKGSAYCGEWGGPLVQFVFSLGTLQSPELGLSAAATALFTECISTFS